MSAIRLDAATDYDITNTRVCDRKRRLPLAYVSAFRESSGQDRILLMSRFPSAKRIIARIRAPIERAYLNSSPRNAVLAIRSRPHAEQFVAGGKRFVIFLVPGADFVGGGILSIFSIAAESARLLAAGKASVAVCTAHGEPRLLRYTKFDNDIDVLAFDDLVSRFPRDCEVLVHIPEIWTGKFVGDCAAVFRSRNDIRWRFNILLQNIDLIPSREDVASIKALGPTTATTAHRSYSTEATATKLGCPVHYLSTWVCPEIYERVPYSGKKKLVMVSPDYHPDKAEIIRRIARALPDHKIIEIRNMTYQAYRNVIRDAKFAFTFGEGLDGYLIEPIFSGGVGMAIFNRRFFTDEYQNLDGIFSDSKSAVANVEAFLTQADHRESFEAIAERQFDVAARNYVRAEYLSNIRTFYKKYFPSTNDERATVSTPPSS